MAKVSSAGSFTAFSHPHGRRARAKRLSRATVDVLEPRRLLAIGITTEIAGAVGGTAVDVEVVNGKAYVLMGGLTILDVSGTGTPVQLGRVDVPGAGGVSVSGSYACVWGATYLYEPSLRIVDISNPAHPAVVGSCLDGTVVRDAWLAGSYAYLAMPGGPGLQIVDISNPTSPILNGALAISNAFSVTVAGSYAYVTGSVGILGQLTVVNIADPAHPVKVGSCTVEHGSGEVAVEGTTVYAAGMGIFDVSDPTAPYQYVWYHASAGVDLKVSNSIAYMTGGANWMEIVDCSDPLYPVFLGYLDTYGNGYALAVSGSTVYVCDGQGALAIVNVADPARPYRTAVYDPPAATCVAFSGSTAYVNDGTSGSGLHIINIQNFDAPTWVGRRDTLGRVIDIAVSGSYLYLTEGSRIEIFNISTPRNPVLAGSYTPSGSPVDYLEHIVISGSYAYVTANTDPYARGDSALSIFDLANPLAPKLVGEYNVVKAASDVAVSGTIAYLAATDGLRIIDVSNPANPVGLSSLSTPYAASSVSVAGSRVYFYAHPNSYIVDVSNPLVPVVLNAVGSIPNPILAISGGFAYTSRNILDVSNPTAIRQVGAYTLFPNYSSRSSIAFYSDSSALITNGEFETVRFHIGENLPPTDISLSKSSVAEGQSPGSLVGRLSTSDPNAFSTFTYSLVSGVGSDDNASFSFASSRDLIFPVRTLDYETRNSYSIRVRSTDEGGLWVEKAFTISVTDVNEAPMNISLSPASITENQPVGTVVGRFSSNDQDPGNTFTYSLVSGAGSTDNASFTISGGQLLAAASFDYETKNSYSIRVRSTDQGGLYYEKVFTVNVTTADITAPSITAVYVMGSTWRSNYLSFLAANTPGSSATYGYAIPTGSGALQLQTLPWWNLNRISIAFSEDVSVAQAQFAIVGSVGSYSISSFSYSSADHVATWSLSAAMDPDKLYIALAGTGATPVRDAAGNALDGEWANPGSYSQIGSTDTFPSGNGSAGGDFAFRFDVLPGDSSGGSLGKVNVADALQTKGRSGLPMTVNTYRSDFDGNNAVNVADVLYVKSKSSVYSLPVNPPVVPVFGPLFSPVNPLLSREYLLL